MNRSTTKTRPPQAALRLLLAVVLAVGLMPLPAFAPRAAADELAPAQMTAQEAAVPTYTINDSALERLGALVISFDSANGSTAGVDYLAKVTFVQVNGSETTISRAQADRGKDNVTCLLNANMFPTVDKDATGATIVVRAEGYEGLTITWGDGGSAAAQEAAVAGNAKQGGVTYAWSYGGSVTYAAEADAESGVKAGFTVTPYNKQTAGDPAEGRSYVIDTLVVDGEKVSLTEEQARAGYTVASASSSVFATFAYTVSFNTSAGGSLTVKWGEVELPSGAVVRGGKVLTITAAANGGYELDGGLVLTGLEAVEGQPGQYRVTAQNGEPTPAISAAFKASEPDGPATYAVTASVDGGNGELAADKEAAAANDTVTLTPTASEGYELDSLTVSGTGGDVAVSKQAGGTYTFTMPACAVTATAKFKAAEPGKVMSGGYEAETSWYDGSKSDYEVSTVAELAGLAYLVNTGNDFSGKTVRLTADLDMNETRPDGSMLNWEPIGATGSFKGAFDGGGHVVRNLYCVQGDYAGLFGLLGGEVSDLGVTGYVECTGESPGGEYNATGSAGGISGSGGGIARCFNAAKVVSCQNAGGISAIASARD